MTWGHWLLIYLIGVLLVVVFMAGRASSEDERDPDDR